MALSQESATGIYLMDEVLLHFFKQQRDIEYLDLRMLELVKKNLCAFYRYMHNSKIYTNVSIRAVLTVLHVVVNNTLP